MNKIRTFLSVLSVVTMAMLALNNPCPAWAQEKTRADSLVNVIRLQTLKQRQLDLKKKIGAEDKKRNRAMEGVSAESLEGMNLVQDSVCLELRSELVSVELQIKELVPNAIPAQLIRHYNNLRHAQPQSPGETSSPQEPSGKKE